MKTVALLPVLAAAAVAQDTEDRPDGDLSDIEYFDITSDLNEFEATLANLAVDSPADVWTSLTPKSIEAAIEDASCTEDWDDTNLVEGENVSCYTVTVPEDYDNPNSNKLKLHVLKYYGNDDAKNNTDRAMFVPAGGPGPASRHQASASVFSPATDLGLPAIMWDYRGMGLSEPLIDCTSETDVEGVILLEFDDTCINSHANQDVEFKHYGTTTSVIDLDSIRRAFGKSSLRDKPLETTKSCDSNHGDDHVTGFQQIYLNGISYGSTMSLAYMQYFPDNVIVAVLEGVSWPGISSMYEQSWVAADRAVARIIEDCNASDDCPFDDPAGDWEGFKEKVSDVSTDDTRWFVLCDFWNNLNRVAGVDGVTHLPLFHHAVATDNEELLAQFSGEEATGSEEDTAGSGQEATGSEEEPTGAIDFDDPTSLNLTFQKINTCLDNGPMFSSERLDAYYKDSPAGFRSYYEFGIGSADATVERCESIGATDADQSGSNWLIDPPTTKVPTLIVSGTYDAITPPSVAAALFETLPNAKLMYLKGRGHGGTAATDECSKQAMMDFLSDPDNFEVPDCIGEMTVAFPSEFQVEQAESDSGDGDSEDAAATGAASPAVVASIAAVLVPAALALVLA